mmetsp:Transcript_28121/g.77333  ORF Transcript_28121/g.77333 Transcript_28121/m.77333 type:complete len:236 (-) Transcript_28121:787-1494(-)
MCGSINTGVSSFAQHVPQIVEVVKRFATFGIFFKLPTRLTCRLIILNARFLLVLLLGSFQVPGKVFFQILHSILFCYFVLFIGRHVFSQFVNIHLLLHGIIVLSFQDPIVFECVFCAEALLRIDGQHSSNKRFCSRGRSFPVRWVEIIFTISRSFEYTILVLIFKWQIPTQQQKQNNANTPQITLDIISGPPFQNFGRQIPRCPTQGSQSIVLFTSLGKTKVRQLDIVPRVIFEQ